MVRWSWDFFQLATRGLHVTSCDSLVQQERLLPAFSAVSRTLDIQLNHYINTDPYIYRWMIFITENMLKRHACKVSNKKNQVVQIIWSKRAEEATASDPGDQRIKRMTKKKIMYFSLIVTSGPGTPTARSSETQTPPIWLVFITDEINIKARIKMFDRKRI